MGPLGAGVARGWGAPTTARSRFPRSPPFPAGPPSPPPPAAGARGAACGKALCINYAHDAAAKKIQVAEGGKKNEGGGGKRGGRGRGERKKKYIYIPDRPPHPPCFPFSLPSRPPSAQRSPPSPLRLWPARAGGPGAAAGPDRLPGRAELSQAVLASLSAGGGCPGPRAPAPSPLARAVR